MGCQAYRRRERVRKYPKYQSFLQTSAKEATLGGKPWWSDVVEWALASILLSLFWGWIAHSRRASKRGGTHRLVHPLSTLIVGLLGSGFFVVLALAANLSADPPSPAVTLAFLAFALLGLPIVLAFFFETHEVSATGIAFRNFYGVRKALRWDELYAVRYSPSMKWFRLQTRSGTVARVSVMLTGLPGFASLVLHHAPGYAIDNATRALLAETAAGRPPVVWG